MQPLNEDEFYKNDNENRKLKIKIKNIIIFTLFKNRLLSQYKNLL